MKRDSSAEVNEEFPAKAMRLHSAPCLCYQFSLHQKVTLDLTCAFVYYDSTCQPNGNGIIANYPYILQANWKAGVVDGQLIVANYQTKTLEGIYMVKDGCVQDVVDLSQTANDIVDNLATAERWEGSVCNHVPCGWGVFYDEDNRIVYEGFRYKDMNVCYGTFFHNHMTEQVAYYQGMIYNNQHYGMGRFFDRNGKKEYEGEWIDDDNTFSDVFAIGDPSCRLHSMTRLVTTNKHSTYYSKPLLFRHLWRLEAIEFGDSCFMIPLSLFVVIDSLPALRSLTIGSFTCIHFTEFTVSLCSRLERISIANKSFIHCQRFTLKSRNGETSQR